jgi:hypothetical protein
MSRLRRATAPRCSVATRILPTHFTRLLPGRRCDFWALRTCRRCPHVKEDVTREHSATGPVVGPRLGRGCGPGGVGRAGSRRGTGGGLRSVRTGGARETPRPDEVEVRRARARVLRPVREQLRSAESPRHHQGPDGERRVRRVRVRLRGRSVCPRGGRGNAGGGSEGDAQGFEGFGQQQRPASGRGVARPACPAYPASARPGFGTQEDKPVLTRHDRSNPPMFQSDHRAVGFFSQPHRSGLPPVRAWIRIVRGGVSGATAGTGGGCRKRVRG